MGRAMRCMGMRLRMRGVGRGVVPTMRDVGCVVGGAVDGTAVCMPICCIGMRLRMRGVGRGVVPMMRDVGKLVGVDVCASVGGLSGVQMAEGAIEGDPLGLWLLCCNARECLAWSAVAVWTREGE